MIIVKYAVVAELADALDSKSSSRKRVWVRPPSTAYFKFYKLGLTKFVGLFLSIINYEQVSVVFSVLDSRMIM